MEIEVLEIEAEVRVRRDYFHREALDRAGEVLAKAYVGISIERTVLPAHDEEPRPDWGQGRRGG